MSRRTTTLSVVRPRAPPTGARRRLLRCVALGRTSSCWRFAAASDPIKNSHCQKNKEVGNQPQNVLRTSFLPFPARDLITALVDGAAASGRVARAACNIEPRLTVTRAGLRRWLKITTEAAEQPRQEDDCNALCPDFRGEDESVLKVSRGNQGIR